MPGSYTAIQKLAVVQSQLHFYEFTSWNNARPKTMIVCSCNVISSREIETAVEDLVAIDADVVLTPGMVYRAFGCRPKCGTCLRHLAQLMHKHREALQAPGYNTPGLDTTP